MKTFYSIVFVSIRPNVDEKVSIGLFMSNDDNCRFEYSQEKLQFIRHLVSPQSFNLIKTGLRSFLTLVNECALDGVLPSFKGHAYLKESYFDYLSRYANNLLTYSAPTTIDVKLEREVFERLFEKFVYQFSHKTVAVKPIETIKRQLVKSLAKHVSFDVELTKATIPGLIVPAKVWFFGKNEVEVTGEAKDFSVQAHILQQQLNAHLFLVEKIRDTKDGKNAKFFIIGDEPPKSSSDSHDIWKDIRNTNFIDLVPTPEVSKIEEYMITHGVEPIMS